MAKILVAEDEKDIRELVGFTLQLAGHNLVFATNGREAVLLAESERPDLLLMDYRMPYLNGDEAATIIHQNPELAHLPVIYLTAKEQDPSIAGQVAKGAHFIPKPFSIDQLNRKVNEVIAIAMNQSQ